MPWQRASVRDQRLAFVWALQQPGATMTRVCATFGISRPTGYRWATRFATTRSAQALADQSRRPHHSPRRTAAAIDAQVLALRATYGWGGAKLATLLAAAGVVVSHATVDRILARHGVRGETAGQRPALRRFERTTPNALWQMDFKGQYPLAAGGWCFPFTVVDDYSRFAVGLAATPSAAASGVQTALRGCFDQYGLPTQILMDHGTPWWSNGNGHGLSRCAVWLLRQDIALRYSGVRHPQTQGKVERLHRTLGARLRQWGVPTDLLGFAAAFTRFREEYNTVRPHAALGQRPPASRYAPSPRAFVAEPRPWDYPADQRVQRIDASGYVRSAGTRFFVCEALADEWVGCRDLDGVLLVQYRQMYVRQYDTRTGRSAPVLQPIDQPLSSWP